MYKRQGTHRGRDRDPCNAHTTKTEAPGQTHGAARDGAQTQQRQRAGTEQTKRTESETVQIPNTITHTRTYKSTRRGLAVCGRDPSVGAHGARGVGEGWRQGLWTYVSWVVDIAIVGGDKENTGEQKQK